MMVAPRSVKTLSGVANEYDDELVVRAACVALELLSVTIPGIKRWDGRTIVPDEA
jgi:3-polyprenyl-4-hydroxybenzoate decarboxylase